MEMDNNQKNQQCEASPYNSGDAQIDNKNNDSGASSKAAKLLSINNNMFDYIETLGGGAFGQVFKVKCLESTKIGGDGDRVLISQQSIKKVKDMLMRKTNYSSSVSAQTERTLLKDEFYVIKVISVADVPEKIGFEAMQEIDTMSYYDSFINDQNINIVIDYCGHGDLNSLVEKHKAIKKPISENVIWKIFINVCLGLHYLHQKNIIHRDLKSLNVFMVKESIAKIGDLGCAIELPPEPKKEDKPKGTDKAQEDQDQKYSLKAQDESNLMIDQQLSEKLMQDDRNPFEMINDDDLLDLTSGDLNLLDSHQGQGTDQQNYMLPHQVEDMKNPGDFEQSQQISQNQAGECTPIQGTEDDLEQSRVGTPYYLAPEIWKSKRYGKESDIWALGVILYEMCCLKYPFPASEMEELEKKVINDKIAKYPNDVSRDFIDIFTKMLKKDLTKRLSLEEIIYSDIFQQKAQQNLFTLPLHLNKKKVLHQHSIGKLDIELTDVMRKCLGIPLKAAVPPKEESKVTMLKKPRVSLLDKKLIKGIVSKQDETEPLRTLTIANKLGLKKDSSKISEQDDKPKSNQTPQRNRVDTAALKKSSLSTRNLKQNSTVSTPGIGKQASKESYGTNTQKQKDVQQPGLRRMNTFQSFEKNNIVDGKTKLQTQREVKPVTNSRPITGRVETNKTGNVFKKPKVVKSSLLLDENQLKIQDNQKDQASTTKNSAKFDNIRAFEKDFYEAMNIEEDADVEAENDEQSKSNLFKRSESVFKNFKEDSPHMMLQMLDKDIEYSKIKKFVKSKVTKDKDYEICFNDLRQMLLKHYKYIVNAFMHYTGKSSSYPTISLEDFQALCIQEAKIKPELIKKIFIATNVSNNIFKQSTERSLHRYEFLEILIRFAVEQPQEGGKVASTMINTKKLIDAFILNIEKFIIKHIIQRQDIINMYHFRQRLVYKEAVDNVFTMNLQKIKKIFQKYVMEGQEYLQRQSFNIMISEAGFDISEELLQLQFSQSKMSIWDTFKEMNLFENLTFDEFLILLSKLAYEVYKETEDLKRMGLHLKISELLLQLVKLVDEELTYVCSKEDERSDDDNVYKQPQELTKLMAMKKDERASNLPQPKTVRNETIKTSTTQKKFIFADKNLDPFKHQAQKILQLNKKQSSGNGLLRKETITQKSSQPMIDQNRASVPESPQSRQLTRRVTLSGTQSQLIQRNKESGSKVLDKNSSMKSSKEQTKQPSYGEATNGTNTIQNSAMRRQQQLAKKPNTSMSLAEDCHVKPDLDPQQGKSSTNSNRYNNTNSSVSNFSSAQKSTSSKKAIGAGANTGAAPLTERKHAKTKSNVTDLAANKETSASGLNKFKSTSSRLQQNTGEKKDENFSSQIEGANKPSFKYRHMTVLKKPETKKELEGEGKSKISMKGSNFNTPRQLEKQSDKKIESRNSLVGIDNNSELREGLQTQKSFSSQDNITFESKLGNSMVDDKIQTTPNEQSKKFELTGHQERVISEQKIHLQKSNRSSLMIDSPMQVQSRVSELTKESKLDLVYSEQEVSNAKPTVEKGKVEGPIDPEKRIMIESVEFDEDERNFQIDGFNDQQQMSGEDSIRLRSGKLGPRSQSQLDGIIDKQQTPSFKQKLIDKKKISQNMFANTLDNNSNSSSNLQQKDQDNTGTITNEDNLDISISKIEDIKQDELDDILSKSTYEANNYNELLQGSLDNKKTLLQLEHKFDDEDESLLKSL